MNDRTRLAAIRAIADRMAFLEGYIRARQADKEPHGGAIETYNRFADALLVLVSP